MLLLAYLIFASFAAEGDSGGGKSSDFARDVVEIEAAISPLMLPHPISSPPFKSPSSLAERPEPNSINSFYICILLEDHY